jgi:alpha-amylase/alpha-mannosidase (GH57 family)
MPQIDLCFVWHQHQPFYKDLVRGEYKLPWTRLHGLKDYFGMVEILREFPQVRQTFNLVPSMLVQVEEYAQGAADDPFLRVALQPAEQLREAEKKFLIQYFFQANVERLIYRFPRYGELYEARHRSYDLQDYRDLQVLSQLAWFDEFYLKGDAETVALVEKGRGYTVEDQRVIAAKQLEILGRVIPVHQEFAATGQIEISTTPFYHPILPLVCDSDIAAISHPHVPLPSRFRYPEDAREQLVRARRYMKEKLGIEVKGLWPSEGSVSDEALEIAAECGFAWFATDNGVLSRTLGRDAGVVETYKPYLWKRNGHEMHCVFRDHYLSDLVGFVYSKMGPEEAAEHFLARIRENCGGRDSLVPIILDGENAWEYFHEGGRDFLRALYGRIQDDAQMEAVTVSEAFARHRAPELHGIFPGSWINANFDIWIGFEEDNKAWEYLLRARQAYDLYAAGASEEARAMAYEELLIAEGSDWCWWYGPHHDSANRTEFDQLFRDHLSNVYRLLGMAAPEELSRPILRVSVVEFHQRPAALVSPVMDGEVTSYFEWMGAGQYRVDERQGAMHGGRCGLQMLHYGTDGRRLYLRLDFDPIPEMAEMEIRVKTQNGETRLGRGKFAAGRIVEAAMELEGLGYGKGDVVPVQVSLWLDGLPMEALPAHGWLDVDTADPSPWR